MLIRKMNNIIWLPSKNNNKTCQTHTHTHNPTNIHIHLNITLPNLEDSINQGDGELQIYDQL